MSKVRVYELAKEYGMKGPELAKLLKAFGLEKVKSHMAVLDDPTELHARALIEAQGHTQVKASTSGSADDGMPKKKALPSLKNKGLQKKALPGSSDSAEDEDTATDRLSAEGAADSMPAKKALPPPVQRKAPRKKLPSQDSVKTGTGATVSPKTSEPKLSEVAAPRTETAATPPVGAKGIQTEASGAPKTPAAERSAQPNEAKATEPKPTETQASGDKTAGDKTAGKETPPAEATSPAAKTKSETPASAQPETAKPETTKAKNEEPQIETLTPKAEAKPTATDSKAATPATTPAAKAPAAKAPAGTPQQKAPAGRAPAGQKGAGAGKTPAGTRPIVKAKTPGVRRLIVPAQKATVVGRIELPQEAIRDAKRRSAPGGAGRNPGGVDRNLRRRALSNTQSRSAARPGARGPGGPGRPGMRRGPGVGGRGRGPGGRSNRKGAADRLQSTVDPNKVIEIEPPISVKGMSEALGIKVNDLIFALTFKLNVIGKTINSFLNEDEIELVALEVGRNIKIVTRAEAEAELIDKLTKAAADVESIRRPPVVTFMGHVDHGKTSLVDAFRKSDVRKSESGGITQHIGAYKVTHESGNQIVILDTPGHEAFTQMRARGASLTDVVVLVVAADDGVMPQTEEAIAHAKEAGVPIVVAINKSDKAEANPMQVKQQLSVKGLQAEDWGGEVQMIEVSAITGMGLDDLLEKIQLEAEILELHAKPSAAAEGVVIESKQTPEQGVVINVLITNGTIRVRDQVLCGEGLARVRGIVDDHGNQLQEAGPATPISLIGMSSLPIPGDKLYVVNDKRMAKDVAEDRARAGRMSSLAARSEQTKVTMDNLASTLKQRLAEETKIILKADVMGSLEPIKASLAKLNTEEVRVNIIHSALGGITETDVSLAAASGAMIIGFNSVADSTARIAADRANVDVNYYDVIYNLIDEVKMRMEGMLKPAEIEEVQGHAEVRAIFRSSKFGNIAGLFMTDGIATRNSRARLSRDGRVVYSGEVSSIRREKDEVKEIRAGFECGMTLKDFNDIKEGDIIEFHTVKYVKRKLE